MDRNFKNKDLLRRHPKNWLHKAYLLDRLNFAKKFAQGRLLDVGCAEKPYEELFSSKVTEYIGVDHPATFHPRSKIDIFAAAAALPFRDGAFDTVLATQVIEHLAQPALVFKEIQRVLKPGGYLIITAPHIWALHEEPSDYYRYTKYGLEYLCQKAGLKPDIIEPMGGFWATFSIRLSYYVYDYLRRGKIINKLVGQLCRLLQLVGYELEKLDHVYSDTHNYLLVAGKE